MYTNYNYMIPEERKSWRSAQEIEMAALAHENRRIQMLDECEPYGQARAEQKSGFLTLLQAPLAALAVLIG